MFAFWVVWPPPVWLSPPLPEKRDLRRRGVGSSRGLVRLIYVYIYIYIYVYTHIIIHKCVNTYTYIYIYMYLLYLLFVRTLIYKFNNLINNNNT